MKAFAKDILFALVMVLIYPIIPAGIIYLLIHLLLFISSLTNLSPFVVICTVILLLVLYVVNPLNK